MLQKFDVRSVHGTFDDDLHKYVNKKLGGIDKYLPKHARESAHAEVFLKETKSKARKNFICEINLHLPQQNINIQEDSLNMFAAVDIVETKLKQQLKKYKDLHMSGKTHRLMFARFRRSGATLEPEPEV